MTAHAEEIHFADGLDVDGFVTECLCNAGVVERFNDHYGTLIASRRRGDKVDVRWTPRERELFTQFVIQDVMPSYSGAVR